MGRKKPCFVTCGNGTVSKSSNSSWCPCEHICSCSESISCCSESSGWNLAHCVDGSWSQIDECSRCLKKNVQCNVIIITLLWMDRIHLPPPFTWAMADGTVLTKRMVLEGASLMLFTPKSVTVLIVLGTELIPSTVKSETVLMVSGTTLTPWTAVSILKIAHQQSKWSWFLVVGVNSDISNEITMFPQSHIKN